MKGAAYEKGYTDGYLAGVKSLRERVDSSTSIEAFIAWYDREFPGEHRLNSRPIESLPPVVEEDLGNVDASTPIGPESCASATSPWVEERKIPALERFGRWLKWLLLEWKGF